MNDPIRVAVSGSSAFEAEYWGSMLSDDDLQLVGTVSDMAIETLIGKRAPEVIVLGGDHQPARAARLRTNHPSVKIVGTGHPEWCSDVDAWADRPEELSAAVLTTFLY